MRVVLINAPASAYEKSTIAPMGILNLAAFLESHGHEVKIVDVAATRVDLDEVVQEIASFSPGLIGTGALVTAYAYLPMTFLRWGVELYFAYYKFTRLFYKTAKDRQYEYNVDEKGGLLPDNLIVGKPQRHLTDDKLAVLKETPCAKVQLMTQRIVADIPSGAAND